MQGTTLPFEILRQAAITAGNKMRFAFTQQEHLPFCHHVVTKIIALCLVITIMFFSNISRAQTADFTISNKSGCVPLSVNFTDISSGGGGVVSRTWDLGY